MMDRKTEDEVKSRAREKLKDATCPKCGAKSEFKFGACGVVKSHEINGTPRGERIVLPVKCAKCGEEWEPYEEKAE